MEKILALNKLERLMMTDTIRAFLEKLPIKSMREIRHSNNIYEGSGTILGNEVLVQVRRLNSNKNIIVRKPGMVFIHPFNNQEDSEIAANKFLQNIA